MRNLKNNNNNNNLNIVENNFLETISQDKRWGNFTKMCHSYLFSYGTALQFYNFCDLAIPESCLYTGKEHTHTHTQKKKKKTPIFSSFSYLLFFSISYNFSSTFHVDISLQEELSVEEMR